MKKTLLLMALAMAATFFSADRSLASLAVTYEATAAPDADPDGFDRTTSVNVWEFAETQGDAGNFFAGNHDGNNGVWVIFDNGGFGGSTATHTFAGGALLPTQALSLDYAHNTNIDPGTRVGIRLLDSSNAVQTEFSFVGGGAFDYSNDGGSYTGTYSSTGKTYDPNDFFTVTYSIGSGGAYTATASAGDGTDWGGSSNIGSWSGSVTNPANPIAKIQVFTDGGGSSDQYFDNLTISAVPEPSAFLFGGLVCGVLGLGLAKKKLSKRLVS
ncbi:hypothetical protein [Bythopirellula goksoeyrii]|nr:hypothetical protein [Bythopirellula goksoeyrii]